MAQAPRDENHVPTLLAVSNADGTTPVTLYADPTTHRLLTSASGGAAPSDATYVTLSTNATLTNERVLTGTANQVVLTDNGAGSTIVLSLPQSIATSSTPTFASLTLSATGSLTLGTASSATGQIVLRNSTNANTLTLQPGATGASITLTFPTDDGDANEVLTTNGSGVLSWEPVTSLGGANTALSNLAAVAINTALLPDAAAADDFGSATLPFKDIFLAGSSGTPGTNNFRLTGASTSGTRVVTLFNATDTVVGKATTDTFTNKTYDTAGTGNAFAINGTSITAVTGSGAVVLATSPTLVTPVLGAATATSINGLTITSSTGTLTVTNGKTLSVTNTLTLSGTDGTTMTFPTTTATIARTDAGQTFTGVQVMTSPSITTANLTGTQLLAENASIGLDPSLSADGTWSGITITGTSGYSQAFGDLVYLDPTDSRWEAVDANAASGADGDARGLLAMVVVTGTDGNACTLLLNGVIRADANFPAFTVNNPIYASETAGDVTQTQPTTTDVVIRIVGAALTADSMYFNPDNTWITHT